MRANYIYLIATLDAATWGAELAVGEGPKLPGCFPCDQQAATPLPPREDVVNTDHWREAHAFNSALPGWLVLLSTRHVASFTELTPEAADELGGLVRRLGTALEALPAA